MSLSSCCVACYIPAPNMPSVLAPCRSKNSTELPSSVPEKRGASLEYGMTQKRAKTKPPPVAMQRFPLLYAWRLGGKTVITEQNAQDSMPHQSRYLGRPLSSSGSGLRRNRPLARLLSQCSLAARTSSSTKLCWAGGRVRIAVQEEERRFSHFVYRGLSCLSHIPRCTGLSRLRLTCRGASCGRRGCCLRTSCRGAARGCPARPGRRSGACLVSVAELERVYYL